MNVCETVATVPAPVFRTVVAGANVPPGIQLTLAVAFCGTGGLKLTVRVTGRALLASQSPGVDIVPLTLGHVSQFSVRVTVAFASPGAPMPQ